MKRNTKISRTIIFVFSFNIVLIFPDFSPAQIPDWTWVKSLGGNKSDGAQCITTDALGNVLIAGYFDSDTLNFDTVSLTSVGNDGIFLV